MFLEQCCIKMNVALVSVAIILIVACNADAADWTPDKRIEIVVPNAAGGGNDRIARLVQHIAQ